MNIWEPQCFAPSGRREKEAAEKAERERIEAERKRLEAERLERERLAAEAKRRKKPRRYNGIKAAAGYSLYRKTNSTNTMQLIVHTIVIANSLYVTPTRRRASHLFTRTSPKD